MLTYREEKHLNLELKEQPDARLGKCAMLRRDFLVKHGETTVFLKMKN